MEEFDIAIIGGGPAGIMAAIAAADLNVVLLEKTHLWAANFLLLEGVDAI